MNYKMKVIITNPDTEKGMFSSLCFDLDCKFRYNPEQYGNGYSVSIAGKEFYQQIIDLRYDKSFDRHNKAKWLEEWAKSYWSGKNGAWAIKTLEKVKDIYNNEGGDLLCGGFWSDFMAVVNSQIEEINKIKS